jgi:hypothetical protein
VPVERSGNLAVVIIAALEGAIILARIRHDLTPFDALVLELGPLLDAVTRPAARLRDLVAPTGPGRAKVDEIAAVRGVRQVWAYLAKAATRRLRSSARTASTTGVGSRSASR